MESLALLIDILKATLSILALLFAIAFLATAIFVTIVTLGENIHAIKRVSSSNKKDNVRNHDA